MFGHSEMILIVVILLALVFAGVHIAIGLGVTAAIGIYLMTGDIEVVRTFVANTAYEALRDYIFAVIPLFMLMGDFLAKCGAATDLYTLAHRVSRWLPAGLRSQPLSPMRSSPLSPASASRRQRLSRGSPIRKCAATATIANLRSAASPAAPVSAC